MALRERDVRLALEVVEVAATTQNGSPFGGELLDVLCEAIGADSIEYFEWPFDEECSFRRARPCDPWSNQDESEGWEVMEAACSSYPLRDLELKSSDEPLRTTDIVSTRAYRRSGFYALMMRPFGLEHELKLWLPSPRGESRAFDLFRASGRNFDDRDVALLRLVRPHLVRLRARWERARSHPQLTQRERDVLELVARGLTNPEVAARLFISTGTVRTHLEHAYDKLGVRTRAGAVAAAFGIA